MVANGLQHFYFKLFKAALDELEFNDEDTLRKAGAKTDVYETFKASTGPPGG